MIIFARRLALSFPSINHTFELFQIVLLALRITFAFLSILIGHLTDHSLPVTLIFATLACYGILLIAKLALKQLNANSLKCL